MMDPTFTSGMDEAMRRAESLYEDNPFVRQVLQLLLVPIAMSVWQKLAAIASRVISAVAEWSARRHEP